MKVYAECYLCFISQAIRTTQLSTQNREKLLEVTHNVINVLRNTDHSMPPPLISDDVYGTIRKTLNIDDPYKTIKEKYNKIAYEYTPALKNKINTSKDRLLCALKISLAGNIIDFGAQMSNFNIEETLDDVIENGFKINSIDKFRNDLKNAKSLVFIADNAGEIVFDKMLLETIKELYPNINITVVVRGGPIINDVTKDDITGLGLEKIATIVDSGQAIPGYWPKVCSGECLKIQNSADIIIAKGQGNFETLSEIRDKRIYFLFIIKCSVVSKYLLLNNLSKIFAKNDEDLWARVQE